MKILEQKMQKGMYKEIYDELESIYFHFTINNIASLFPKMDSYDIYVFTMYAISRKETADKHIVICDALMFLDPCFSDSYNLIAWHLRRALEVFPNNNNVLQWITCTFNGHPDSPFSEEELFEYNNLLNSL